MSPTVGRAGRDRLIMVCGEFAPVHGGISVYSRDLVLKASEGFAVDLFLWGQPEDGDPPSDVSSRVEVHDVRAQAMERRHADLVDFVRRTGVRKILFNHYLLMPPALGRALKRLGARLYVVVYGADVGQLRGLRNRFRQWRSLACYAEVVTISQNTLALIRRRVPGARVCAVIPPGISHLPGGAAEETRRGVISVGRLVRRKGLDVLLRALERLPEAHWRGGCTVIGDGPQKEEYQALARELGIADRVHFAGSLPDEDVVAALQSHRVFCQLPRVLSDGDVEGFGIVFVEAAAAGCPVLAGRSGGVPDAVGDGINGMLVDPESVPEVAAALERLLGDPALWSTFAAGSVAWARRFYWPERPVEEVFSFLAESGRGDAP